MINIDSIFERGYVEQNLLKQILKTLLNEIENLKTSSNPFFKFNEVILIENKQVDDEYKEFFELTFEPKNKKDFIILAEYFEQESSVIKTDFISPEYIEDIKLNKIYFKNNFDSKKYIKFYITYQY